MSSSFQRLFDSILYNEGIKLDEEGWYSVTPEAIASAQAERCQDALVIDCFSGVGGNAIQFAKSGCHVIAIDVDPQKIEISQHNANIYGVGDYIDFIIGDFFHLAPFLKGNVAFLSPPWGGPDYNKVETFSLEMLEPQNGYSIFQAAQRITPNIIFFLPRNVDFNQINELSWLSSPPLNLQIEENHALGKLKGVTAYFGSCASTSYTTRCTNLS